MQEKVRFSGLDVHAEEPLGRSRKFSAFVALRQFLRLIRPARRSFGHYTLSVHPPSGV